MPIHALSVFNLEQGLWHLSRALDEQITGTQS